MPTGNNCEFLTTYPGYHFTKLAKLKNWVVPMMYYDGARMCSSHKLPLHDNDCHKNTQEMHEDYAKIAPFMYYLFWKRMT